MSLYPLPVSTAQTLEHSIQRNQNLGLSLDKYLAVEGSKFEITTAHKNRKNLATLPSELIEKAYLRWEKTVQAMPNCQQFSAAPEYRLVVGFGAEHVLETNLYLHRIYGIPIIPGSALKGLARAYAFWCLAVKYQIPALSFETILAERKAAKAARRKPALMPLQLLDELLALGGWLQGERYNKTNQKIKREQADILQKLKSHGACDGIDAVREMTLEAWNDDADIQTFTQIFGSPNHAGQVIFFDAYPKEMPKLEPDLLNPHYPKYYTDKKAQFPTHDQDPVPVNFLTVAKGSRFAFAVAGDDEGLAKQAYEFLQNGLQYLGIGGKTAAGYGYFADFMTAAQEEEKKEREAKARERKVSEAERKATDTLLREVRGKGDTAVTVDDITKWEKSFCALPPEFQGEVAKVIDSKISAALKKKVRLDRVRPLIQKFNQLAHPSN